MITLIRDEIPLEDQAAKAKMIEMPAARGEPAPGSDRFALLLCVVSIRRTPADRAETKSTTADVAGCSTS